MSPPAKSVPENTIERRDLSRFAISQQDDNQMQLLVEGMHCANCAFRIEETLNKKPEVQARVNLTSRRLNLHWHGRPSRVNQLVQEIENLGYKLTPYDVSQLENQDKKEEKFLLYSLAVAGFASGNIMLLSIPLWSSTQTTMGVATRDLMHWISALIAIPTVIFAGRPFFRSAWQVLQHGRTNMDVPISVALVLTTCMSLFETIRHGEYAYFDSVTMLLFLLLIGRYLDRRTRGKARAAAQDLLLMTSGTATVIEDGRQLQRNIGDLRSGMLLQVAAGEKIAVDGVVENGISEINPCFINGETTTQLVVPGTSVFGGMINLTAPLKIRITAASSESLLGEIIKLMDKAEQGHAKYIRLADRIARYYTPVVHLLALITFLSWLALAMPWQESLLAAMTVLIITCPCALGLAVPAVQVLTSGRLFRHGMLLKSADAIERLSIVDTIVFDKTGTLTLGKPKLANPSQIGSRNMQLAVSLAQYSKHPLCRALCDMYGGKPIDLDVMEHVGQGVEAVYESQRIRLGSRSWCGDMEAEVDDRPELWLHIENEKPVRFAFEDMLRQDAEITIRQLKEDGYAIHLLSGDREKPVSSVAGQLGIENFQFQISPANKHKFVEGLIAQGRHVLMVGDGLNDAAALAVANVSMSLSSALDIAQNAADVVIQGDRLGAVTEALVTAKRAQRLVKENFVLSVSYNVIAVPLAMLGLVTPLFAAIAMAGSSIMVVLNAQRLNWK